MKLIIALLTTALVVSGCTTTGTSKIDTALQNNLPKICSAAAVAHTAFSAVAATGKIKASTVNKEGAAYAGIQVICSDPEHETTTGLIVQLTQSYIIIVSALKEAKAVSNG